MKIFYKILFQKEYFIFNFFSIKKFSLFILKMKKIQYLISLILLISINSRSFLEREILKIDEKFYIKTNVYIESQKSSNNFLC